MIQSFSRKAGKRSRELQKQNVTSFNDESSEQLKESWAVKRTTEWIRSSELNGIVSRPITIRLLSGCMSNPSSMLLAEACEGTKQ